ncbi:MAG: PhzF family phenazine biosynthesis protein, partial [Planctomycetota bacterium]|nr:PhzF family phenazine biosynthesis protein [Planctomycetota bacterium]
EDPVTGSAHCTSAPYWAERLVKNPLRARQISERGGDILCTVKGDRVELAGDAVLFAKGQIHI